MVDATTLRSLDASIANWAKSIEYMQRFQANADAILQANPSFAKSPLDYTNAITNAQKWLDFARAARSSGDAAAIRATLDTARNAWRVDPAALNALRQGGTAIVQQIAPAVEGATGEIAPVVGDIAPVVTQNGTRIVAQIVPSIEAAVGDVAPVVAEAVATAESVLPAAASTLEPLVPLIEENAPVI